VTASSPATDVGHRDGFVLPAAALSSRQAPGAPHAALQSGPAGGAAFRQAFAHERWRRALDDGKKAACHGSIRVRSAIPFGEEL
jgi:hypothetical protein